MRNPHVLQRRIMLMVIALLVVAASGLVSPKQAAAATTMINNSNPAIVYQNMNPASPGRGLGDYQDDVHYATLDGAYFQYTFTGTGIEYITEKFSDQGQVDIYIDGVFKQTVDCYSLARQVQVSVYSISGLTSGTHTIKGVKKDGTYMLLDALRVTSDTAPVIKVAAVGDSITTGSYPAQLGSLLGSAYEVRAYGVGGTTMLKNGDHPYWDTYPFIDSGNWLPDIVIIMLGTNDSAAQNWQYKNEFLGDYTDMINHYKNLSSSPTVYVALSPEDYWPGNVVSSEVVPLQIQAANNTGSTILDVNTATKNMAHNFPDNIHPNEAGSTTIATVMYNGMKAAGLPALVNAYGKTEAEDFNSKSGSVQAEWSSEGSPNLGFIGTGDYVVYNHYNFGNGATKFDARIASDNTVGRIEIRLDSPTGTLAGTVYGVNTGSYQTYTTQQTTIASVTGIHNVYLVFTAGLNLNWFQFKQ
ncbi:carbohydrate-binding protein [Paenibacillus nasutitermitis]|uniref:CBM6 domain-containing protein n=1 Tax=Paenibacillus nasutitermitis TaxID=1652958 RepID=A0A916YLN9_9BACL|nr:carbohydrate-binding protein [Paenibacillus nasutitermitis]GGD51425.1 hypothetical protein GCM10010911_06190 [Paenibacillus nasutitermitis]